MSVPNVSVDIEITNLAAARMEFKGPVQTVSFDVKVKLEEKEHRSQMVTVSFCLLLSTRPSIVKFEVEGVATLTGKDDQLKKMLEVDPETKMPVLFQKVYQHVFTSMYLMSTVLNTPPPPSDLFYSAKPGTSADVNVEVDSPTPEAVHIPVEEQTEAKQA